MAKNFCGLGAGDGLDIGWPPDHGVVVGNRAPEHEVELLLELGGGVGFGPHPALFAHHVALGVELPEDRVEEALGLHPEPQLELVGGHRDEVDREVVAGAGIHARGAGFGVDLVELVLDDEFLLLRLEDLHLLAQLGQDLGLVLGQVDAALDLTGALHLAHDLVLGLHLETELIELSHDLCLSFVVRCADGRAALEHHVFEEMGDAGGPDLLVDRPDVGDPAGRDGWALVAFDHQNFHAVVQKDLLDGYLGLLGCDGKRAEQHEHHQTGNHLVTPKTHCFAPSVLVS